MNFGMAKMSRTDATKVTGFEDHFSEFVMKLETGPRKNQHVKVRKNPNNKFAYIIHHLLYPLIVMNRRFQLVLLLFQLLVIPLYHN